MPVKKRKELCKLISEAGRKKFHGMKGNVRPEEIVQILLECLQPYLAVDEIIMEDAAIGDDAESFRKLPKASSANIQ